MRVEGIGSCRPICKCEIISLANRVRIDCFYFSDSDKILNYSYLYKVEPR